MDPPSVRQKSRPEDFRVEEITLPLPQGGPFGFYRLDKRGLGTPEAIDAIAKRWRVPRDRIAFGGLKDRHAVTSQFLTIRGGPRRDLRQTNFDLAYLGQVARPFSSKDITANRFEIVLRNLRREHVEAAMIILPAVRRDGLPNYFDHQRFGSVGDSGDFVARAWCAEQYERAVWLTIADANPHDRPPERDERRMLVEHWNDWAWCLKRMGRSWRQGVVGHLASRPGDFRGAMAAVPADLRSLYVAAFQSHLWNGMLAELLRRRLRPEQLAAAELARWSVPYYRELDSEQLDGLRAVELPLPSARNREEMEPWRELIDPVLAPLGLSLEQVRIKRFRETFFSKGSRPALSFPAGLEVAASPDEVYAGRRKLTLRFELSRGSYATVVTQRIMLV